MDWFSLARNTSNKVKEWSKDVVLIFHNDADGICSGTLGNIALKKLGKNPFLYCIEKMYPEIIEKIHAHHRDSLYLYLDIGSGEVPLLEGVSDRYGGEVVIIDHHKTQAPKGDTVINLDPELFGISGDKEACAASLVYLMFKQVCDLSEFADLAVVGSMEIPGEIRGLNSMAASEANVERTKRGGLKLPRFGKVAPSVSRDMNVLGAVGYYSGGVPLAMEFAEQGYNQEIRGMIKELEEKRRSITKKLLAGFKLKETQHIQWFNAGDAFRGMGTKTIGTFCSYLTHRYIAPDKLLLGFMHVEHEIPRLNGIDLALTGNYSKVSARAPAGLKGEIEEGKFPSLGLLLSQACSDVGGFADGHDFAASGVLPRDRVEDLINSIEKRLGGLSGWL